jgi:hypothetical protein
MTEDNNDSEFAGSKWLILKELSAKPSSPKQLAERLNTTIANMSQQLKLLDAYGYVKKNRVDRGKEGRKNRNSRILFSINKNLILLTSIQPASVTRKEIKPTPENIFFSALMLLEFKEEYLFLSKFYIDNQKLFGLIDALFYLRTEKDDIHLLVLTEDLAEFRETKSKLDVEIGGKIRHIRFWSHTIAEFREGLMRKEKYFIDHKNNAKLLFEKKPNTFHRVLEETQ